MKKILGFLVIILFGQNTIAQHPATFPTYDSAMREGRRTLYSYPTNKSYDAFTAAVKLSTTEDQKANATKMLADAMLKQGFAGTNKIERDAFDKKKKEDARDLYVKALGYTNATDSTTSEIWLAMVRNLEKVSVQMNGKYLGPNDFYNNALALKDISAQQRVYIHTQRATTNDYLTIVKGNFASDEDKAIALDKLYTPQRNSELGLDYLQQIVNLKDAPTHNKVSALFSIAEHYSLKMNAAEAKAALLKLKKLKGVSPASLTKADSYLKAIADYQKQQKEKEKTEKSKQ